MRLLAKLRLRARSLFTRSAVEQELDEEMQYHLDRQIDEYVAAGMSAKDARLAALASLGGFAQRKEECRDMRGVNLLDNATKDLRFAIRQLRRNAGFTFTAIFVLALGLCASLAIFAFVDAALIRPLPYRDAARLVGVFGTVPTIPRSDISFPDYLDLKRMNRTFASFDAYQQNGYALTTPAGVEPVHCARVTDGFFRTLGVAPLVGRDFYRGEDLPQAPRTLLLGYKTWQTRYGGKTGALGRTVVLDGLPHVIVGVLPAWFHFAPTGSPEFWVVYHKTSGCDERRSCHGMHGVARLRDGISLQLAVADITSITKTLERQYPESNRDQGAALVPLTDVIVGDIRPMLILLLGGAALLLLIATVNVMGLLMVRSEGRKREVAVRTALGASSGRLLSQFATESFLLVLSAGVIGVLCAQVMMKLLTKLIPENVMDYTPYLAGLGLNLHLLVFAGAISVGTAVLFALVPQIRVRTLRLRDGLAEGSRGSAGTVWRKLGSKMVILELATAMVLLAGAGLLVKSLYLLLHVELGLQPDHLVTMNVAAPKSKYGNNEQAIAFTRRLVQQVKGLPGVISAGFAADGTPIDENGNTTWFRVLGRPWHGEHNEVPQREVSSDYFTTLGAKLLRGRYFLDTEDGSKLHVAIVNESFVRKYFPYQDPLGKHLSFLSTPPVPIEIVGVVENIREGPLDEAIPPVLYVPFNQNPDVYFGLVVRAREAEGSLIPAVTAMVRQMDSGIAVIGATTMNARISNSPSAILHRSTAWLVGGFALLALVLGVVGLYGVVSYSVSQRKREIGVRIALGAQPQTVYRLILSEAGWITALGLSIGLGCSIGLATLIRGLLFGISSTDMPTLASVAAALGISALLASLVPARRATLVNPVEALRAE